MLGREGEVPEEITTSDQIFDLAFHPKVNALAVGLVSGAVEVYRYETGKNTESKLMLTSKEHTGSCRGTLFSDDGERLYTISSDQSIKVLDGIGRVTMNVADAHDDPINRIISLSEGGSIIATGDDAGCVKLWDMRTSVSKEMMSWELHEDFVSGFAYNADAQTLLSVGGDATLCAYDIRKQANANRSDDQEAELHCVQVMKGGRKVVCGTQDGVILFFTWGRWGDCSDRYPGHPETVDCFLKLDESTVLTGSSDGLIRAVALQPNKILGVIGDHEEFPVEGMRSSRDGRILGSFAHDEVVRFWDISMFADDEDRDELGEGEGEEEMGEGNGNSGKKRRGVSSTGEEEEEEEGEGMEMEEGEDEEEGEEGEEGEWEDMEESSSEMADSDDDDDSDEDESGGGGVKKLPTAAEKFFADL
jgi:WD repeat-containing protein 55